MTQLWNVTLNIIIRVTWLPRVTMITWMKNNNEINNKHLDKLNVSNINHIKTLPSTIITKITSFKTNIHK